MPHKNSTRGIGAGEATPKRVSPVEDSVSLMDEAERSLRDGLGVLENRLVSVITPPTPKDPENMPGEVPEVSSLAERLRNHARFIEGMGNKVRDLIDRLEV